MKTWNNKLFKTLLFLFVTVIFCSVLTACDNKGNSSTGDSDVTVQMTDSYKTNRANFKAVTGIELPALEKLEADEYPYQAGDDSYCFDIIGGDNLNYQTYLTFENFFKGKLGDCDSGYPAGDETIGRDAQWTENGRWYQTFWDKTNKAIYINTTVRKNDQPVNDNMTESYRRGREQFHTISGIWLPQLENIELLSTSLFDVAKKDARFKIANDANNYVAIVSALKEVLANEPLANNNNHWEEEGFMIFWEWDFEANGRMHKVTVWAQNSNAEIEAGYVFRDYYTITLTAQIGGSVELNIAGHGQNNNTAHVCYNTYSELYATAMTGYRFVGFYEGNTLLGTDNPLNYMVVKDVDIVAEFEELPSNMEDDYKEFRTALYRLSGITLPQLEGVNTDHEYLYADNDNHVRDEAQAELLFSQASAVNGVYAEIKTIFVNVIGTPEETMSDEYMLMDQWSIPYYEAPIPYRVEVMMTAQVGSTSINLMWRKQPIVIINVESDGPGVANGVYINSNYEEVPYTRYFEISDAFHGTLVATPNAGKDFVGWYVNGELVSKNARYIFSYAKADVTFTEITFVGKFKESATVQMTNSYSAGRDAFADFIGVELPAIGNIEVEYGQGSTSFCFDIFDENVTADIFNTYKSFFDGLTGWTKQDHNANGNDTEYYDTYLYQNANGDKIELVLMSVGNGGKVTGVFINAFKNENGGGEFASYSEARSFFLQVLEIDLPDIAATVDSSSYTNDASEITLDLIIDGCTESVYNLFVNALSDKLGNGVDNTDMGTNMRTDWQINGLWYSVEWDLTTYISINISSL